MQVFLKGWNAKQNYSVKFCFLLDSNIIWDSVIYVYDCEFLDFTFHSVGQIFCAPNAQSASCQKGAGGIGRQALGVGGPCPSSENCCYFGVKIVGLWCVLSCILMLQPARKAESTHPPPEHGNTGARGQPK